MQKEKKQKRYGFQDTRALVKQGRKEGTVDRLRMNERANEGCTQWQTGSERQREVGRQGAADKHEKQLKGKYTYVEAPVPTAAYTWVS